MGVLFNPYGYLHTTVIGGDRQPAGRPDIAEDPTKTPLPKKKLINGHLVAGSPAEK